jgi:hypothetical protein
MDRFKYNGIVFLNRLELFVYLCRTNSKFSPKMFYHSKLYYCRAALEKKFNRRFSMQEVKELIKDMPQSSPPIKDNNSKKLLASHT